MAQEYNTRKQNWLKVCNESSIFSASSTGNLMALVCEVNALSQVIISQSNSLVLCWSPSPVSMGSSIVVGGPKQMSARQKSGHGCTKASTDTGH